MTILVVSDEHVVDVFATVDALWALDGAQQHVFRPHVIHTFGVGGERLEADGAPVPARALRYARVALVASGVTDGVRTTRLTHRLDLDFRVIPRNVIDEADVINEDDATEETLEAAGVAAVTSPLVCAKRRLAVEHRLTKVAPQIDRAICWRLVYQRLSLAT